MQAKKVAFYASFLALALILSYVELFLPLPVAIPGVKVGLANLAVVILLYREGVRGAGMVSVLRVLLSSLLFGTGVSLAYSMAGAVLSLAVMAAARRFMKASVLGVSILGGVFHNIGQLAAAMMIVSNTKLAVYLPVLLIAGMVTGAVIGVVSGTVLRAFEKMRV